MSKHVLAIDPGASGGYAVSALGRTWAEPLPETEGERAQLFWNLREAASLDAGGLVCVMELVGGFVGLRQPGAAMFKFGNGYGFLRGVLMAYEIPLHLVTPQTWQKPLGLGKRSECATPRAWKVKLKEEAQRRFPQIKVTHATGDALLILEHAATRMPEIFL